MKSSEAEKYLKLESILKEEVIGQEEAIPGGQRGDPPEQSGNRRREAAVGLVPFCRSPTGVGKTLLAKVLAQFLFDDEKALTQIDMSEYMEKFSVSA